MQGTYFSKTVPTKIVFPHLVMELKSMAMLNSCWQKPSVIFCWARMILPFHSLKNTVICPTVLNMRVMWLLWRSAKR